jgi:dTDP-4-dehydrorhamnose reductase
MADPRKRVLITGAGGFLGRTLHEIPFEGLDRVPAARERHLRAADAPAKVLDITREDQVRSVMDQVRPDWVINTAAMTSVDGCERQPEEARRVHVGATEHLVRACEATGSGLITISTNYVFDGVDGPYTESDDTHPLNVYGRTKLEGERRTLAGGCPGIVVRTAVLYGYRKDCRPNFVTWAAGSLAHRSPIRVVSDEWANPTPVDELARFLLSLCNTDFRGLVHFAGLDFMTRYEMVAQVCECFGLDLDLVTPVTSAEFGQPAKRPLRAGLQVGLAGLPVVGTRQPFREHLDSIRSKIDSLSSLL